MDLAITTDPRAAIFMDPAAYADPVRWHEIAAELRREAPILPVEAEGYRPFHVLTRHADVFEVSRRHDLWHNTKRSQLMPEHLWDFIVAQGVNPQTLVHLDGDAHRDHRKVTNDWFKPAAVRHRQGDIDAIADEFVAKMLDLGGECDFAQDVAVPYTLRVIMSIFGVPVEDEPMMLRLTQGIFGAADPEYLGDLADPTMLFSNAMAETGEYFGALAEDRRACPANDLATVIANGQIDGCPLSKDAELWYFIIVATAGHDTTSYALGGGLQALMEHPEQIEALRQDPELIVNATEEIIRWTSPVRHFMRYATQDTSIHGVDIPEGGAVMMPYWCANRDEDVFVDPMQFDITRADADQLISFGIGAHYCLGSQFARREVRTFLPKLLERVTDIEPAGPAQWAAANFVGGVKHLPITYKVR